MIVIQNHGQETVVVSVRQDIEGEESQLHRVDIPPGGSEQIHFEGGQVVAVCLEEDAHAIFDDGATPDDYGGGDDGTDVGNDGEGAPESAAAADQAIAANKPGEDTTPEANVSESASGAEGGTVDKPIEERPDHEVR